MTGNRAGSSVLLLALAVGCSTVPEGDPEPSTALRLAAPAPAAERGPTTGARPAPGPGTSPSAASGVWHGGLGEVLVVEGEGGAGASEKGLWGWDGLRWLAVGSSAGPGHRLHPAVAYDGRQDLLVLHGGRRVATGEPRGDTWVWDGTGWRRGGWMGPGVRWGHAMVWRSRTGQLLLFGGASGPEEEPVHLADTWTREGRRWRRREVAGPPGRWGHALAYDARRDRVVLFGGSRQDGLLGDTWEWDGMRWRRLAPGGSDRPEPRVGARMAWDAARGVTVLFGGRGAGGALADTWSWDGLRWRRIAEAGPVPPRRSFHAMDYDPKRGRIVLFGGTPPGPGLSVVWEWTGRAWVRRPPAP